MSLMERNRRANHPAAIDYELAAFYDEAFASSGQPRAGYGDLLDCLAAVGPGHAGRLMSDSVARGGGPFGADAQPFPVGPVPRLLAVAEWRWLGRALGRRVRALNACLCDVYGSQKI